MRTLILLSLGSVLSCGGDKPNSGDRDGEDDGLECGEGTHAEDGECVPDGTSDADTDTDTDTDADADTDTDADADTDTGTPPGLVDDDGDGYSEMDGDCDDTDPAVSPSATDVVGDGIDQNCDGVDGTDADGDGYASEASGGDDCDDTDASISPDAGILDLTDGVDQNCDGYDGLAATYKAAEISLDGDGPIFNVGDVDGDGSDDLGVLQDRALYVFFGSSIVGSVELAGTDADIVIDFSGRDADAEEYSVSGGDFDGDGLSEIAIGLPNFEGPETLCCQGLVEVMRGSDIASGGYFDVIDHSWMSIYGHEDTGGWGSNAGKYVDLSNDVDLDGYLDLIIGAPANYFGGVYLFRGGSWVRGAKTLGRERAMSGDYSGAIVGQFWASHTWASIGIAPSAAAFVDRGDYKILAGCTSSGTWFNPTGFFTQALFSGARSAQYSVPGASYESYGGSYAYDYINGSQYALVIGDITGDDAEEIAIAGVVFESAGLTGGGHELDGYQYVLSSPSWHAHYGNPPADFNGDGIDDVVLTTPAILLGSTALPREPTADIEIEEWGGGYAAVGDFDGDGVTDLALGGSSIYFPGLAP